MRHLTPFAQTPGLSELAEPHGDEVVPTRESLATAFAAGLADEFWFCEAIALDERKKLAEKIGGGYVHGRPPCSVGDWFFNPLFWTVVNVYNIVCKLKKPLPMKHVNPSLLRIKLAHIVWGLCISSGFSALPPESNNRTEANVSIDAGRVEGRIEDRVYGQFLEHIYHSCNGGLWGELIWNRSFEDSFPEPKAKSAKVVDNNPVPSTPIVSQAGLDGPSPNWKLIGSCTGSVVSDSPFNSLKSLHLNAVAAGDGIQQDRIRIKSGETYRGSLWLRGQCEKGLECRLISGGRVLASVDVPAPGANWTETPLQFSPAEDARDGSLQILAKGNGECWIDQVSLMPDAARAVGGFRPDLLEAAKGLHPTLIRWPGGGYASNYRWKNGIGPQSKRVSQIKPMWNDTDVNSLGTDEFVDFCRRVGAEPLLVLNLAFRIQDPQTEETYLNEALEWIEYCNGDVSSPMGALRAANGHPTPYNIQCWELDNEWYFGGSSSAGYIEKAAKFSQAIRKRYPNLTLTACGSIGYKMETDHEKAMLARIGASVQSVSLHRYESPKAYDQAPATWNHYLDAFALAAGEAGHPDVRVYASEWNGHTVSWDNGLLAARLLLLFERRSDVVWGAAPALFLRHVSATGYNNALINFDHAGWFPGANYVVMKLFREHFAADRLPVSTDTKSIEAVATKSRDGKSVCIKLANPESHPVRVRLSVSGTELGSHASAQLIAPENLRVKASLETPEAIRVVPATLQREGKSLVLEMPAWSVGVIEAAM